MHGIRLTGHCVHDVDGDLRKSHEGCFMRICSPGKSYCEGTITRCNIGSASAPIGTCRRPGPARRDY